MTGKRRENVIIVARQVTLRPIAGRKGKAKDPKEEKEEKEKVASAILAARLATLPRTVGRKEKEREKAQ